MVNSIFLNYRYGAARRAGAAQRGFVTPRQFAADKGLLLVTFLIALLNVTQ
jgi:hypothetical protein